MRKYFILIYLLCSVLIGTTQVLAPKGVTVDKGGDAVWLSPPELKTLKNSRSSLQQQIDGKVNETFLDSINYTVFVNVTGNYVIQPTDLGKTLKVVSDNPVSITLPLNSYAAFPIGSYMTIINLGSGIPTVTIGATGTIESVNDAKGVSTKSIVTALKYDTNSWLLFGDLQ